MDTTERLFKEGLEDIEHLIEEELPRLHKASKDRILKIIENALRDRLAIGTLPPANFPAGLIYDGDSCDETCATKLGWAGAHEIDYDVLEGV